MGKFNKFAAVAAGAAALAAVSQPAAAAVSPNDASKLRQLDIMLMVTSLRCRFGADNFQPDYERFASNHNPLMQDAFRSLQADYTARMGPARTRKALDSISVGMANSYGQGHPWLGCGELKAMTRELAGTRDHLRLVAAADEALAAAPRAAPKLASSQ
ncbi:S-adenosyl-L-homocysteine hydrolase [Tsuneonella sp. HG249]